MSTFFGRFLAHGFMVCNAPPMALASESGSAAFRRHGAGSQMRYRVI
jgi:hypothetical protein